jgi:hypothetical protein
MEDAAWAGAGATPSAGGFRPGSGANNEDRSESGFPAAAAVAAAAGMAPGNGSLDGSVV